MALFVFTENLQGAVIMPVQDVSVPTGEPTVREHDPAPPPRPPLVSRALDRSESTSDELDEEPPEEAGYGYGV